MDQWRGLPTSWKAMCSYSPSPHMQLEICGTGSHIDACRSVPFTQALGPGKRQTLGVAADTTPGEGSTDPGWNQREGHRPERWCHSDSRRCRVGPEKELHFAPWAPCLPYPRPGFFPRNSWFHSLIDDPNSTGCCFPTQPDSSVCKRILSWGKVFFTLCLAQRFQ